MGFKPAALLKMNFFADFLENFVEDCMFLSCHVRISV